MSTARASWTLHEREDLLGTLTVLRVDLPWLSARFLPTPSFRRWQHRFEEELHLLDGLMTGMTDWEEMYRQITRALTLRDPGGRALPGFLLHIDGDAAWWRRFAGPARA